MNNFLNLDLNHLYSLFSQKRILAYTSIKEHFDNLALIGCISENLGIAEILLRNKIDFLMSVENALWIENIPESLKPNFQNLSKDNFISRQSLGFWLKIVDYYKIHTKIFSKDFLEHLNFKRYYAKNVNRFKNKANLQNYHKVSLLLYLLRNLRNRAFHFENLYKLNEYNKPRLSAKLKDKSGFHIVINLETNKIQVFLEDLIKELIKRDFENGGKASPRNESNYTNKKVKESLKDKDE